MWKNRDAIWLYSTELYNFFASLKLIIIVETSEAIFTERGREEACLSEQTAGF